MQIVWAAGFGADAGHAEAAEGLAGDECAGASSVDVEVADAELFFGLVDVCGFSCEDAAGEFVCVVVGQLHRLVEVFGMDDGEDWAEDFLGVDGVGFGDACEDVGGDEVVDSFGDVEVLRADEFGEVFIVGGFDESSDVVGGFLVDDG